MPKNQESALRPTAANRDANRVASDGRRFSLNVWPVEMRPYVTVICSARTEPVVPRQYHSQGRSTKKMTRAMLRAAAAALCVVGASAFSAGPSRLPALPSCRSRSSHSVVSLRCVEPRVQRSPCAPCGVEKRDAPCLGTAAGVSALARAAAVRTGGGRFSAAPPLHWCTPAARPR